MARSTITSSSTAEYFAKNLQQVGFSSPVKAVLTTVKEAVDNSLDACEEAGVKPEIFVSVKKIGKGSGRNAELIHIVIEDNGPGLDEKNLAKVFGEYLASSKFGKGQCSRGQQGIGISAATTWAQLTNATGVLVVSKTANMRKALQAIVDVDIKGNKGLVKNKKMIEWTKKSGIRVEFKIDGKVQINGDGGLLTYLEGTALVNPHLTLKYELLDRDPVNIERVTEIVPKVPAPTMPHPHTMKLGEFITHTGLYGKTILNKFLKSSFSRISDACLKDFVKNGIPKSFLKRPLNQFKELEFKNIFQVIQNTPLPNPSTKSVLTVGEEGLAQSIQRLGTVDFFSVVTRKPRICDFKPVVVEVAIARFLNRGDADSQAQVIRYANRVPLQFDKGACAVTKGIESVNWKAYGLSQSKGSVPTGPYVFAIAVTSPFIKFKNASKETIDASDELVEEIRLALMRAGQKLSRHIKKESKAADLERKLKHIESFGPILVNTLARMTNAPNKRKEKAEEGLKKLLGRDSKAAEVDLERAENRLRELNQRRERKGITFGKKDEEVVDDLQDESKEVDLQEDKQKKLKIVKKDKIKKTSKKIQAKKKSSPKQVKKKAKKKVSKKINKKKKTSRRS